MSEIILPNDEQMLAFYGGCVQGSTIYIPPDRTNLSSRKVEALKKIAFIQKYYQCNPVRFIEDFFNITLIDAQAWVIQAAWNCPNVLLNCTRGFGKSTIIDLFIMSKDMLFNNYWTYIASGSGNQAEQTFNTLEKLANDNIDSMLGSTGYIFKNELVVPNAVGDGFNHSSNGFRYELYNGASTITLNSNIDRRRGSRGNVVFDECGFLSAEMMQVYGAFAIVSKEFRTGKDSAGRAINPMRLRSLPAPIPNQLFYISSASSTDTPFYGLYRDFSKRMLLGDPKYFVAQLDCEVAFAPTVKNEVMAPLLERSIVEAAMRANPEKARREYYCEFTTDAGANAIIRRGAIARNEITRKPILYNDTGKRKIIITYDPARSRDNSVILVGEIYETIIQGKSEIKGRLLNCINLIDVERKNKKPMQTPDQVKFLKEVILAYNQGGDDNYSNILGIYIDAGSGGAGVNIADYLMDDFIGLDGKKHKGLIDLEYSAEYASRFPNAVNKVHLINPRKYKPIMFEAMIEMINQDKIEFTASYDGRGYLTIFDVDESKIDATKQKILKASKKAGLSEDETTLKIKEALVKLNNVNSHIESLTGDEAAALMSIDALKEELVNMVRIKRESSSDSFELTPEKKNKLHDDRAYTMSMFSYALQQERRKKIVNPNRPELKAVNVVRKIPIKKPKIRKHH